MRFDFKAKTFIPPGLFDFHALGWKCLVNGKEIGLVWFADTELGIVKTYDVFGDGKVHATGQPSEFPGREVECPIDGAVSETLRGTVELLPPADYSTAQASPIP